MLHYTTLYNTIQYNTTLYNTILHTTIFDTATKWIASHHVTSHLTVWNNFPQATIAVKEMIFPKGPAATTPTEHGPTDRRVVRWTVRKMGRLRERKSNGWATH